MPVPTIFFGDYLTYNKSYYLRVRVWDSTGLDSDWVYYDLDGDKTPDVFIIDPHAWPSPQFGFLPSMPGVDQPIQFLDFSMCYGSSYSCQNINPNTGGYNQYIWDFGDGTTSNERGSVSHSYSAAGTYEVTLTIRDDLGSCLAPRSVLVVVGPGTGETPLWKEISPF